MTEGFECDRSYEYIDKIQQLTFAVMATQLKSINACAKSFAKTLAKGNRIHLFGTGHSHMLAEELFYRAGGLVNINPILDEPLMLHSAAAKSTKMERLEGYAEILFEHHGLKKGDLIVIISNSGRNGVCIDMALLAKERGVFVVVLTNMNHTLEGGSRHSSGKLLYELADIVLDNCGCVGDAAIEIEGFPMKVAPTSTVMGAMILNAVVAQTVQLLVNMGIQPEVFASSNIDGGEETNERYIKKYMGEIKSL